MKTIFFLSILLYLSFHVYGQVEKNPSQPGMQIYKLKTVNGIVTVHLPDKIYPGETISGTVLAEPTASGNAKKDRLNKVALLATTLNIFGNRFKLDNQTLKFSLPDDPFNMPVDPSDFGPLIRLEDQKGTIGSAGFVVQEGKRSFPGAGDPVFPTFLRSGEYQNIPGKFDGVISNTRLMLNDLEIPVACESPGEIVTLVPENISGVQKLSLTEGGKTYSASVNVVDLKMTAKATTLQKGERSSVLIVVDGLKGIETPVTVNVDNLTPMSIGMQGGNQQVWVIHPEEPGDEGIFRRDVGIMATASGAFSVSARISEPPVLFDMTGKNLNDLFGEEGKEPDPAVGNHELCGKVFTSDWKDTGKDVMELDPNGATQSTYRGRCENCSTNVTWKSVKTPFCKFNIFERQVLTCSGLKGHTGQCHGPVTTEKKQEKDPSYTPNKFQETRVCQKCGRTESRWVSR